MKKITQLLAVAAFSVFLFTACEERVTTGDENDGAHTEDSATMHNNADVTHSHGHESDSAGAHEHEHTHTAGDTSTHDH